MAANYTKIHHLSFSLNALNISVAEVEGTATVFANASTNAAETLFWLRWLHAALSGSCTILPPLRWLP